MAEIVTKRMTPAEFNQLLIMQKVPTHHHAFRCPTCGKFSSMETLVRAGLPDNPETRGSHLGHWCPHCHLELERPGDFNAVPPIIVIQQMQYFQPATPEEAQALHASWRQR